MSHRFFNPGKDTRFARRTAGTRLVVLAVFLVFGSLRAAWAGPKLESVTDFRTSLGPLPAVKGESSPASEAAMLDALRFWRAGKFGAARPALRLYLRDYPDSRWAGAARLLLADDYAGLRRFTTAKGLLREVVKKWPDTACADAAACRLACIDVRCLNMGAAAKKFDALLKKKPGWQIATMCRAWLRKIRRQEWVRTHVALCGTRALAWCAEQHGRPRAAAAIRASEKKLSGLLSLAQLKGLARSFGLDPCAFRVKRPDLEHLALPVVLHLACGHYVNLKAVDGDWIIVEDPFEGEKRFCDEDFSAMWDGVVLALEKPEKVRVALLTGSECEVIRGGQGGPPPPERDYGVNVRGQIPEIEHDAAGAGCASCSGGSAQSPPNRRTDSCAKDMSGVVRRTFLYHIFPKKK